MRVMMDNQYSKVWQDGPWVYKRQHEFLTSNEYWFLCQMYPSGYVPAVEKMTRDLIRTRYISNESAFNRVRRVDMLIHRNHILEALKKSGIRHGDLTEYAVLLDSKNHPYLIDFSESRLWDDPRPDKRPEGDAYWLTHTFEHLMELHNAQ